MINLYVRCVGILLFCCTWGLLPAATAAPADAPGSRDVLVTRLPGYHICDFNEKDFDREVFTRGYEDKSQEVPIEGHRVQISYCLNEGAAARSSLQVYRNYETVLKGLGATVTYGNGQYDLHAMLKKDGRETWVHLIAGDVEYSITLVEKGGMVLEAASADEMVAQLNAAGHVALAIHFDTGRATLRADAKPLVDQIVVLLKKHAALRVLIEGHTDNVGNAAANKALSQARAKTVLDALVAAGVAATRLTSTGFGQERPVAPNTEEGGRAKNRRVVLVKL